MKKQLLAALMLVAAGCTTQTKQPQTDPLTQLDFRLVELDTLVGVTPSYRVEMHFTTIERADSSEVLHAIESSNIAHFFQLEEFDGSLDEAIRTSLDEHAAECAALSEIYADSDHQLFYTASSEAAVVDSLLCYTISRTSYMGGAHANYSLESHVYSLTDGYELALEDIFSEEELAAMRKALYSKLYRMFEVSDDEGLRSKGLFPDMIDVARCFIPTETGLVLYYNPYEIGCFALGSVEVEFSHEEIEAIRHGK